MCLSFSLLITQDHQNNWLTNSTSQAEITAKLPIRKYSGETWQQSDTHARTHTHTHTFNSPLSGWASTRKVKWIWILLKQETVSGSGIRWAICKSAPRSRQITMPASHRSVFYRPDALPAAQPTASKHWRQGNTSCNQSALCIAKWENRQITSTTNICSCSVPKSWPFAILLADILSTAQH